jgi:peptidoglycan/xylan/chitin deacetylase (PgdA/CDA1 family)
MTLKTALRVAAAELLHATNVTAPSWRTRRCMTIVTFHRVLTQRQRDCYPFPGLAVTPEELDAVLAWLNAHFDCGTLGRQWHRFEAGEAASRPLLAVTFDDAQHDNFAHARPLLAKYRIAASFFAPVEAVRTQQLLWHDRLGFGLMSLRQQGGGAARAESLLRAAGLLLPAHAGYGTVVSAAKALAAERRVELADALAEAAGAAAPGFARMMTFEELAQLAAEGHEIGSHSMSHRMMPECSDDELARELAESRRVLREHTGARVDSCCYPNGDCDARTARRVEDAGYRCAVTTRPGLNRRGADRYALRRFDIDVRRMRDARGSLRPSVLAFRLSGFYPGLA